MHTGTNPVDQFLHKKTKTCIRSNSCIFLQLLATKKSTTMQHSTLPPNTLPTVRVRLPITPEEYLLSGIYRQLRSINEDRLRANLIRKILSTKLHIPAVSLDGMEEAFSSNPGTISIRLTISSRDVGMEALHALLHNATSDAQRRLIIKAELEKIQIGALKPQVEPSIPDKNIQTKDVIEINIISQNNLNQNVQNMNQQAPDAHTHEALEKVNQPKNSPATFDAKKDRSFKHRMRDASRMFDL